MDTTVNKKEGFFQSITAKAFFITFLSLFLLIPGCLVQNLIKERQDRSEEVIRQINARWSREQTLSGLIMTIPYTAYTAGEGKEKKAIDRVLNVIPDEMKIKVVLVPEERYYGIYKTITYKSKVTIDGYFDKLKFFDEEVDYHLNKRSLLLGITDFKGISSNLDFQINGHKYTARPADHHSLLGPIMKIALVHDGAEQNGRMAFSGTFELKGSSGINFFPFAKNSQVEVSGEWSNPGFTGEFAPDYTIDKDGFTASWSIMDFNRSLPPYWSETSKIDIESGKFGVNLVNPVDHYQQNMRSAKYALMFIALTFAVFFFVELLTRKPIHILQYLLVGMALIIFYTLLLSISEQLNFNIAYLIASTATILLITLYAYSIFKNRMQTAVLTFLLTSLYAFLFVILQLEDVALLIGSIGLFVILACIMYFSRKINWYQPTISA